jgi:hypothetical protein
VIDEPADERRATGSLCTSRAVLSAGGRRRTIQPPPDGGEEVVDLPMMAGDAFHSTKMRLRADSRQLAPYIMFILLR